MSKIQGVTIPILEKTDNKIYPIANFVMVVGILIFAINFYFLFNGHYEEDSNNGLYVAGISMFLIFTRAIVQFMFDKYKTVGVIRINEKGFILKCDDVPRTEMPWSKIHEIKLLAKEFKGNVTTDWLGDGSMEVEDGTNNMIRWYYENKLYKYKIKLRNKSEMDRINAIVKKHQINT